ncbi:MAG TPA: hypothetical protein VGN64_13325 [Dyadobacter sp.]|nr:hypothetical protein [Dyadobacter sp.]
MKRKFFTFMLAAVILAGASATAFAQKHNHISRSIDDDGNKLSISINGTIDGKNIHYDRTILVAGLTKKERKDITQEVFDSLGLGSIEVPATPEPPRSRPAPRTFISPNDESTTNEIETNRTEKLAGKPYRKEVKFDSETGEMHLRYEFMRNGEEFVYEKTVNAASKTDKQREQIISNFEEEIVLPARK